MNDNFEKKQIIFVEWLKKNTNEMCRSRKMNGQNEKKRTRPSLAMEAQ